MHCVVIGDGVAVADAGKTNEFTIVARDQFDGERGVGGDKFEVSIDGPATLHPVVDCGNGRYTVRYDLNVSPATLAQTGLPTITINALLNNEGFAFPRPVVGSPFNPRVRLPLETFAAAQAVSQMTPAQRQAALAEAQVKASPAPVPHTPGRLAALLAQPTPPPVPAAASPYASPMRGAVPAAPPSGAALSDAHLQATLNVMRQAQAMIGQAPPPAHTASPYASPYQAPTHAASPAMVRPPRVGCVFIACMWPRPHAVSVSVLCCLDQQQPAWQGYSSPARSPATASRFVNAVSPAQQQQQQQQQQQYSPAAQDPAIAAREAALAQQEADLKAQRDAMARQQAEMEARVRCATIPGLS